jgi:hypothetical protein
MIHKAIIVVLTLLAASVVVAWLDSYRKHQVDANHRGGYVVRKVGDICGLISWRYGWLSVERIENCIPIRQEYLMDQIPGWLWVQKQNGKTIYYYEHVTVNGSRTCQFAVRAWVLVLVFSAYPLNALYRGPLRRWRRRRRGLCHKCGYNLRGLTESRCPECSTEFDPSTLASPTVNSE